MDEQPEMHSWTEAELLFPGCGAAWDIQGGPERAGDGLLILLTSTSLTIGWGIERPFSWALWHGDLERWLFVS